MREAHEQYRDQGFEVLSISVQESEDVIGGFVDEHGLDYPFLLDSTGEVSALYGLFTTPTTFFIAPDGTAVEAVAGVVSADWLSGLIEQYVEA